MAVYHNQLIWLSRALIQAIQASDRLQLRLATLSDRLLSPEQSVGAIAQTVSILDRRLEHSLSAVLERADNRLIKLNGFWPLIPINGCLTEGLHLLQIKVASL